MYKVRIPPYAQEAARAYDLAAIAHRGRKARPGLTL